MKKRPTRSCSLPNPFFCTRFDSNSNRAFSMPPVDNTTCRAATVNRLPDKVATRIRSTRDPASLASRLVALACK